MARQRWRDAVLEELRNQGQELRNQGQELRNHGEELRNHSEQLRDHSAQLRNHGDTLVQAVERQDRTIRWLGEQNRAAVRDLKASVDRNTDVTDRCADLLSGLIAQSRATDSSLVDLTDQIRAQTAALLTLVDEIRDRDGPTDPQ